MKGDRAFKHHFGLLKIQMIDIKIDNNLSKTKKIRYLIWIFIPNYSFDQSILIRELEGIDSDIKDVITNIFISLKTDNNQIGHLILNIIKNLTTDINNDINKPNVLFPSVRLTMRNSTYPTEDCFLCLDEIFAIVAKISGDLIHIKIGDIINSYDINIKNLHNLMDWLITNRFFYSCEYKALSKIIAKKIICIENHVVK